MDLPESGDQRHQGRLYRYFGVLQPGNPGILQRQKYCSTGNAEYIKTVCANAVKIYLRRYVMFVVPDRGF